MPRVSHSPAKASTSIFSPAFIPIYSLIYTSIQLCIMIPARAKSHSRCSFIRSRTTELGGCLATEAQMYTSSFLACTLQINPPTSRGKAAERHRISSNSRPIRSYFQHYSGILILQVASITPLHGIKLVVDLRHFIMSSVDRREMRRIWLTHLHSIIQFIRST